MRSSYDRSWFYSVVLKSLGPCILREGGSLALYFISSTVHAGAAFAFVERTGIRTPVNHL